MNKTIKKIIKFGHNSPEKFNSYLSLIRQIEWNDIKYYIPENSNFLDIGCGAGYSMKKAVDDKNCIVKGIDPSPLSAGVKFFGYANNDFNIIQGVAENLPYEDKSFDVVFSSHVLEHVDNYNATLKEMKRVLRDDGVMILGVPTSTLAWLGLFSNLLFTTHIRIAKYFFYLFSGSKRKKIKTIFLPPSHSEKDKTIIFDIENYKIKKWEKKISDVFQIEKELKPALFCYADYIQFFKIKKHHKYSSSVFFVCKK